MHAGCTFFALFFAASLPPDLAACHALLAAQDALLVEQTNAIVRLQSSQEKLSQENEELNLTIQKLLARLRGHRSERHEDPAQQQLDFGQRRRAASDGLADAAAEQAEAYEEITVRRRIKPRKPRNEQLPAHLPRYEVIAEVPPEQQHCAEHGPQQIIGYDVTETLEFERPKLRVRVTKYPKFVCQLIPSAAWLSRPGPRIRWSKATATTRASPPRSSPPSTRYHLPIYRQQDWFAGSGWMPDRSTLLNILASAAYVLEPLYQHYAD